MERSKRFALPMIAACFVISAVYGGELYVGDGQPYGSIQSAIDEALDGDIVIVGPGVYRERINFGGKAIVVRSSDPADWDVVSSTVIDGQYGGSCVTFNQGETGESVLEGFTLTRGTGANINYYGDPRTFSGKAGGGIYCMQSSPTVRRCNIVGNGYADQYLNPGADFGGGIALVYDSQAVIENCVIAENGARLFGTGIIVLGSASSSPRIVNCTVANNRISSYNPSIEYVYYDVDCWRTATTVENTIIWSEQNRGLLISDPLLVRYCCLRSVFQFNGNYPYMDVLPPVLAAEQGNIYGQPGFVAVYDRWQEERVSDYRLRSGSICVDRGDPGFDGAGRTDMDGQSRVMGGRLDIGADEVMPLLTLERPMGGEVWAAGSRHEIRWGRSHGERVFVNNADFHTSYVNTVVWPSPAHISNGRAVCGWEVEQTAGIAYGVQFKPTAGVGKVYGYANGGTLYQLTNDVYRPRTQYTLRVRVGNRTGGTVAQWRAALYAGVRETVAAESDQTTGGSPASGEWIAATATLTTGEAGADALVGERIGVLLSGSGAYFDNVVIDAYALAPEAVDVSYSMDGGGTWELVEAGVPDRGSYVWSLPDGADSQDCRLKIEPETVGEIDYKGFDAAFAVVPYEAGEAVEAEWATLGGDAQRRGLSEYSGPRLGGLKWVCGAPGAVYQGVAVGGEGQVYSVSENGVLTARDGSGNLLWERGMGDVEIVELNLVNGQMGPNSADILGKWDALMITARIPYEGFLGDIVSLGSTVVRVAERFGRPVFGFRNNGTDGSVFGSTPANTAAGAELCVVVPNCGTRLSDVQLYLDGVAERDIELHGISLNREITSVGFLCSDAQVKVYRGGEDIVSHPTVGPDGTIYVGCGDTLYAFGSDGELRWKHRTDSFVYSCPAVDEAGRVFFGSCDGGVYALAADGAELWRVEMPGPGAISGAVLQPVAIGKDGSVYAGGLYDSTLYALAPGDGSVRWQSQLTASRDAGGFLTAPVVGPDGTIYVAMHDDTHLYAIDPEDGEVKWATDLAHKPELIGYWKFNEGRGAHAYDSSQYGRSAINNFPSPADFTWIGGVLGSGVLRGPATATRFNWSDGTIRRTVCVWVKGHLTRSGIVRWAHGSHDWNVTVDEAGRVRVAANGGYMLGKTNLRDHRWHHVAVVLDGHNMSAMRIYVDGRLDADFEDNGGYAGNTSALPVTDTAYGSLVIGESGLPVDDLRLYEVALTESQIRECMWDETAPTFGALRAASGSITEGRFMGCEPVVGPGGTIYIGLDDPYLRAINPDGTVRWVKHLECGGNYTLTIGADGILYAAGVDGVLYAINEEGRLLSRFDAGAHILYRHLIIGPEQDTCELTYPVAAADGTVYVADAAGRVFAVAAQAGDDRADVLTCQKLPFDINGDCIVNLADFAVLALDWMSCTLPAGPCTDAGGPWRYVPGYIDYPDMQFLEADVNRDMYVDFSDVEWIMQMWLTGIDLFE